MKRTRLKRPLMLLLLALVIEATISPTGAVDESRPALEVLGELQVKGRAPKTGFDRSRFGSSWSDVDRNGCDTRNDILKRDLKTYIFQEESEGCVILRGTLVDDYSGTEIEFSRGRGSSALIQIDHVVALSNAWQTGAFRWSAETRKRFANDPLNLKAVKGSLNSQKGDGDAATWLPPNKSYRCQYIARQIAVKSRYALWVTQPEKSAMSQILKSCPEQLTPMQ